MTLNAYSDARRRLSERFRNRGFWPIRSSKGKSKGFGKNKGKFGGGRKSLQDRILSSRCRLCGKMGHWKAECPERAKSSNSSTASGPTASISMTEGSHFANPEAGSTLEDTLHLEFLNLPETLLETPIDEPKLQLDVVSFLSVGEALMGIRNRSRNVVGSVNSKHVMLPRNEGSRSHEPAVLTANNSAVVMFASHGSFGVVDLGASKTVIGSNHLPELMNSFDSHTRDQLQRCPCKMQFRFGNQGVLSSTQALVVPIGPLKVKIAIVPGNTPFLISNAFLRGIQAVVDTHHKHLKSPLLKKSIPLELSPRGLFLMDFNEVIRAARAPSPGAVIETICHVEQKGVSWKNHQEILPDASAVSPPLHSSRVLSCVEKHVHFAGDDQSCSGVSNVRSSTQRPSADRAIPVDPLTGSHVACQPTVEDSRSEEARITEHRSLHTGAARCHDDRLWEYSQRSVVPAHVGGGTRVDCMVSSTLQQVKQDEPSTLLQVCRAANRNGRELESPSPSVSHVPRCDIREPDQGEDGSKGQGQDGGQDQRLRDAILHPSLRHGVRGEGRVRDASGVGAGTTSRWSDRDDDSSRCSELTRSNVQHGEHAPASVEPPAAEGSRIQLRVADSIEGPTSPWDALLAAGDLDEECLVNLGSGKLSPDRHRFRQALLKIEKEYQTACDQFHKSSRKTSKPMHLFEVFCSTTSRLTQQVLNLGCTARRYCKEHTDLMTCEGRAVLFQDLLEHEPMHVWFAPECGPWSAWSNLNQSKSIESWLNIQNQRWENIDQLALGVVLLRHQRSRANHLHWEQPSRSHMFQTPILQEVYAKTVAAEFDMCNLGNLCDPENGKLMKKGMTVLTTSPKMQNILHGHRCKGGHDHQPLEGSTIHNGRRVSRTAFSENYPRKFARYVATLIAKFEVRGEKPWEWEKHEALANETMSPPVKRRRITVPPAARSRSLREDRPVVSTDENQPKRFRILQKGSNINPDELWGSILDQITPNLPRVGKQEISQEEIRAKIQRAIGDKVVKSVVGGRALHRTTGPIVALARGEAPFRKMVYIHKDTEVIHVTPWEKWEDLAKRKLIRTGFPSKIAITIFAANPESNDHTEAKEVLPTGTGESRMLPESTSPQSEASAKSESVDQPVNEHGPAFRALSREDQSLLLKIHKNAGHPGPDKLAYLLRQQGYRSELIAAIPDLSCAACNMMSRPKISRPSAIHSPCDFNDVISMDGYTWKNQQGTSFHFYHIIDSSTNFQVARYAPNRSVEHAIDVITQGWLAWAGSPNELIVDAATELNAEAFANFMQQNNIKCSTIRTNAHWQNGKAERHGEILGQMLSKFDLEQPIGSAVELQQALAHCTQAKNALSIRKGYAPEVLVLGKHTRLPGAVCSDEQLPAHALADSEHCHGLLFRQNLAKRELARRAFHMADNDAVLRRSLLRRTRPSRQWFTKGEWVMVWRGGLNASWCGPMRVVIHENQQIVWVTQHGRLFRHAPEHIRPVTSIESRMIKDEDIQMPIPEVPVEPETSPGVPSSDEAIPQPIGNPVLPQPPGHNQVIPIDEAGEPAGEPTPPASDDAGSNHEPNASIDQPDGCEVPVPDDIHDELVGWHCLDDDNLEGLDSHQGWFGEILITEEDLEQWRSEENPHEMAFLASAAKRQRC